eukprot:TRINITY_DN595_c0_g3_i1.p1 TRINITY_DN595_c0_g3~~TRINITY_DN595_c0_g3_i1.p1  ORF type:complete len:758 (+),score=387.00 TRINITY_DN595_c0_g3_i1:150-2423(+)
MSDSQQQNSEPSIVKEEQQQQNISISTSISTSTSNQVNETVQPTPKTQNKPEKKNKNVKSVEQKQKPQKQQKQQTDNNTATVAKQSKKKTNIKVADFTLPNYVLERVALWEKIKQESPIIIEEKPINITLPDARNIAGTAGKTTPFEIARSISRNLANDAVAAKVNGKLFDLTRPLESDCTLEIIGFDSNEGKHVFWHSSAHILGQALERRYDCLLTVGPALNDCFYYDVGMNDHVSTEHFEEIVAIANDVVQQAQPFERLLITKEQALEMFKYNKYKIEVISQIDSKDLITAYRCGPLIDLCRGPHLPNTNKVKAFHITKNSSCYWKGNADNDTLQRVYGISFPEKKLLQEHLSFLEEVAKRDHRNIGKHQELFFFHHISPGSCFFLPHGARIYNRLIEFIRKEYRKRGFLEVVTPNIYNIHLWETSGHWQNYKEHMFSFDVEGQTFAVKPMNCPGHCILFAHRTRSYRELPFRVADFGVLHRNELSGALTGLTRVRRFQQDDAHIFCREDQISTEIAGALDFLNHVYSIFKFEFSLELSTRPEKYLGKIETWDFAEKQLADALTKFGKSWKLNPGDGAFYGPKIDIHLKDAIGRSHQCATIQLDFQLPERFKLEYTGSDDHVTQRPVIIHRAVLGSVERMIAVLTEHCAGKWPFWISPRQAIMVPVSVQHLDYAKQIQNTLHELGFYIDVNETDDTLNKKIRDGQISQYNYILVVGGDEITANSVNIRTRDNVRHGTKSISELITMFTQHMVNHD